MRKCRLLNLLGFIYIALFLSSCVDERFDMDNVSGDIHLFENGVGFPLLNTGDMAFEKLLSSEDDIYVNNQGLYEVTTTEGHLITDVDVIPKFHVPVQNLDFGTIKSYSKKIPMYGSAEYRVDLPQEFTNYEADLNIESGTVDSRVKSIDSVFVHSEWLSEITLSVICEGSSAVELKRVVFDNYKIVFPADLIIDKNNIKVPSTINVKTNQNNNEIIISGEIETSKLKFKVGVKGVHSESNMLNGSNKVVFNDKVEVKGDISLSLKTASAETTMSFKVVPTLYIPEADVDEAFGKVDLKVNETSETIYINSLPSFLTDENTSLSLYNPYLPIEIKTTLPMSASANIKLYPKDKDGNYICDDNGQQVIISIEEMSIHGDDHDVYGPSTFYEYVACHEIAELSTNGYDFVRSENLGKLTEKIPYSIDVIGEGYNDPSEEHDFFLGEPYDLDIKYNLNVPFFLNAGSKIQYNDSTLDLNTDVFETISAKSIFANAIIKNGFPAEMEIFAELCDVNGEKLDGIEVIIPKKINASKSIGITDDVVPEQTNMRIEFREIKDGQMKLIDRINWRVNAYFPDQGAISKYQKLNMKINLELPDGISIDLDNL